ncbi:hypothetical protein F4823DRAFT_609151 [Ustulina deusta]|nr:hypothetical protein F4823DRAFT_609151 [Ustulina deusta]
MSDHATEELKLPTPEQINKLRDELRSLKFEGTNGLDEDTIEDVLLLPPTLFFEAVHNLTLAFGPLSTFPDLEYPGRPNAVVDDGASFLEDALAALTSYNQLLEEKVAKFSVQSVRSLATLRESSDSSHEITAILDSANATKLRKVRHTQQIDSMKKKFDSYDESCFLRLEEYNTSFWSEALFLNCRESFFDKSHPPLSAETSLWNEYDYVLQHIERWRRLVNSHSSHEGEAIVDHARQLVSGLVYVITRHCQVQLATIFHENLASSMTKPGHQKAVHNEAVDIIREVDWLWEEVIPVAHMSVSAQFLRPIVTLYKDWEYSKKFRMDIVTTYAAGVLKFMNDRLGAVAERTQTLVYHHQALYNLASFRQLKENSCSGDMVPGHMPHTLAHKLRPGPEQTTAAEHVRNYMQLYGVVPIHVDGPFPKPTPSLLDEHVQNRAHKGDTLLRDLHQLLEEAAKSSLTERELGGELLLESLLADSAARPANPGSVYKDTQLEGSIEMLRDQSEQIAEIFKGLKLEGPASAPDYVAHAYRQTANRLAANAGEGRFKGGENPQTDCPNSIRCPKFEEFVRKWGC